ncbi:TIGR01244 family sulfur transferase [Paracoccus sp. p4-l81]|uniref:TIGR01244 family sulfur transferase n=1 Tax=unclassified Paracoccus (in: a-proteobacteria) TaxID=2688777 RepID=UPI0035B93985
MDLRQLTESLWVSPQIDIADVETLAQSGFRSIINNRPDEEVDPELRDAVMAQTAARAGLDYIHLPYVPGLLTPELVADFAAALDRLPGPVLAYCRSGTRSCNLWALAQAGRLPADQIIARGAAAGYDLRQHEPLLRAAEAGR